MSDTPWNCADGTPDEDHDWKFEAGDPSVGEGAYWICRACSKRIMKAHHRATTMTTEGDTPRTDALVATFPREQDLRQLSAMYNAMPEHARTIERALNASVKIQSHYASLLNQWDGGKRLTFTTETWLTRLGELEGK